MRKKLLSLLTVLCLVLGMLPATAMAADAVADLGYSEEDIAMYISEDTELTEDVEGLVVVVSPVKVTVNGAKLTTGLVVVPDAKGAQVTLGENADVNAVIILGAAEVVVTETAVAASVTVTAAESTVTVAGTVATVTVAEEAESTTVTVAETAKVETVAVAAPAATIEVAGTVASVTVAETATGVELVVAETAAVTEVTDNSGELTVSGDGAESVTVSDATAKDDEGEDADEGEGEDEEPAKEPEKDKTENAIPGAGSADVPAQEPEEPTNDALLITAPQADHPTNGTAKTDLSTYYAVESTLVKENTYDVVIHAGNVKKHANANHTEGYWVGFGIPIQAEGGVTYAYYAITDAAEGWSGPLTSVSDRRYEANGKTYNTIYFDAEDLEYAAMKVVETWTSGKVVEYLYNITFDVSLYGEAEQQAAMEAASMWNF